MVFLTVVDDIVMKVNAAVAFTVPVSNKLPTERNNTCMVHQNDT